MSDPSSERVGEISGFQTKPLTMRLQLDRVREVCAEDPSFFAGPDWWSGTHSLGVTVRGKRRRIVIDEATVNPFAQLLYLAMINPKAGSMREVVHGPDARVYQEDWKANHPDFLARMLESIDEFERRFLTLRPASDCENPPNQE